jgi:hypothetical protein
VNGRREAARHGRHELDQRLVRHANAALNDATTEKHRRAPLPFGKSRVEAVDENVRINEGGHERKDPRVSSRDRGGVPPGSPLTLLLALRGGVGELRPLFGTETLSRRNAAAAWSESNHVSRVRPFELVSRPDAVALGDRFGDHQLQLAGHFGHHAYSNKDCAIFNPAGRFPARPVFYSTKRRAARMSSAIIRRLLFSMKKLGPA